MGRSITEVTGAALKAAMESAIPSGMSVYAREKERQLSELGYEEGRMILKLGYGTSSIEEIVNGYMGLVRFASPRRNLSTQDLA
jgi:hypothetical protein